MKISTYLIMLSIQNVYKYSKVLDRFLNSIYSSFYIIFQKIIQFNICINLTSRYNKIDSVYQISLMLLIEILKPETTIVQNKKKNYRNNYISISYVSYLHCLNTFFEDIFRHMFSLQLYSISIFKFILSQITQQKKQIINIQFLSSTSARFLIQYQQTIFSKFNFFLIMCIFLIYLGIILLHCLVCLVSVPVTMF